MMSLGSSSSCRNKLPGENGIHARDGSLTQRKQEQWEREKAEAQQSNHWFGNFGQKHTPGRRRVNWAKDEEELRRKQQQQEEGAKQEQHQRQQNHHHEENAVVAERRLSGSQMRSASVGPTVESPVLNVLPQPLPAPAPTYLLPAPPPHFFPSAPAPIFFDYHQQAQFYASPAAMYPHQYPYFPPPSPQLMDATTTAFLLQHQQPKLDQQQQPPLMPTPPFSSESSQEDNHNHSNGHRIVAAEQLQHQHQQGSFSSGGSGCSAMWEEELGRQVAERQQQAAREAERVREEERARQREEEERVRRREQEREEEERRRTGGIEVRDQHEKQCLKSIERAQREAELLRRAKLFRHILLDADGGLATDAESAKRILKCGEGPEEHALMDTVLRQLRDLDRQRRLASNDSGSPGTNPKSSNMAKTGQKQQQMNNNSPNNNKSGLFRRSNSLNVRHSRTLPDSLKSPPTNGTPATIAITIRMPEKAVKVPPHPPSTVPSTTNSRRTSMNSNHKANGGAIANGTMVATPTSTTTVAPLVAQPRHKSANGKETKTTTTSRRVPNGTGNVARTAGLFEQVTLRHRASQQQQQVHRPSPPATTKTAQLRRIIHCPAAEEEEEQMVDAMMQQEENTKDDVQQQQQHRVQAVQEGRQPLQNGHVVHQDRAVAAVQNGDVDRVAHQQSQFLTGVDHLHHRVQAVQRERHCDGEQDNNQIDADDEEERDVVVVVHQQSSQAASSRNSSNSVSSSSSSPSAASSSSASIPPVAAPSRSVQRFRMALNGGSNAVPEEEEEALRNEYAAIPPSPKFFNGSVRLNSNGDKVPYSPFRRPKQPAPKHGDADADSPQQSLGDHLQSPLRRSLRSPTMRRLQESLQSLGPPDSDAEGATASPGPSRTGTPKPFNCRTSQYRSLNLKRDTERQRHILEHLAQVRAQLKSSQAQIERTISKQNLNHQE